MSAFEGRRPPHRIVAVRDKTCGMSDQGDREESAWAAVQAKASLHLDGIEPTPRGLELLEQVVDGQLTSDEAVQQLLDAHRR